jgi:hypothetical protein
MATKKRSAGAGRPKALKAGTKLEATKALKVGQAGFVTNVATGKHIKPGSITC